MATFNDLAVELQEAIWTLVLPTRGVHWIEVEGIPHEPAYVRESIRMTQWHQDHFGHIPDTHDDAWNRQEHPEYHDRAMAKHDKGDHSGAFFRRLFTTVPAFLGCRGLAAPDCAAPGGHTQLTGDLADEVAYTRRCRQLSTYTQIATMLSTCHLSRVVAQRRIRETMDFSWPIHRSMGPLHRPRPLSVWQDQYGDDAAIPRPDDDGKKVQVQQLAPRIHAWDLVVFRLHDQQGRPTPLLQHAAWQYGIEAVRSYGTVFACFDRVGIEWHPSWATSRDEHLRAGSVEAVVRLMAGNHFPSFPYWLVDGVPRPDWRHDYPVVVEELFAERMAREYDRVFYHLDYHWDLSDEEKTAMLVDHHLGQEFEANGRRYYIVFVVSGRFNSEERRLLRKAGLGHSKSFPGSAKMWPEALREPVRAARYAMGKSRNFGMWSSMSLILSWEPI